MAALVTYAKNITDASVEAIQRDHDEISKFFETLCSKERVRLSGWRLSWRRV